MFVISVPALASRIHRREDGMDSPREAALCGDCRGEYFHLSTHAFYVSYDSLMANGTDEDRVAIAVWAAQLRHMSETVIGRFVLHVSIDILHFNALMTSVATPCFRISTRSPSSISALIIDSPLARRRKKSPCPVSASGRRIVSISCSVISSMGPHGILLPVWTLFVSIASRIYCVTMPLCSPYPITSRSLSVMRYLCTAGREMPVSRSISRVDGACPFLS